MKLQCPECGARGYFEAFILHSYIYDERLNVQSSSVEGYQLLPDDQMRCRGCGYTGPARIFAIGDDE